MNPFSWTKMPSRMRQAMLGLTALLALLPAQAATLEVTNLADSGLGTLRAALMAAQNGDVITFAVTGTSSNLTVTNVASQYVISNNVSIIGPGPEALVLAGRTNSGPRLFQVLGGVTASLSGLTLRDSYAEGSGIYNDGTLLLTNCTFLRCKSTRGASYIGGSTAVTSFPGKHGGAIYNAGTLTAVNCNFLSCQSGLGGTPDLEQPAGVAGGAGGHGGAIYSSGTLSALNCNFLTNSAAIGGYGGSGSLAQFNLYPPGRPGGDGGHGGAVYATGPATFVGCTFGFNTAGAGGAGGSGASRTSPGTGNGSSGAAGGRGGHGSAVFSLGQASFTSCTLANNSAGTGGKGGNGGNGNLSQGGSAGLGGDGGNGTLYSTNSVSLIACTLTANTSGQGGNGGTGGNGAANAPGGNGGHGGAGGGGQAIYADSSNVLVTLQNVLVAANPSSSNGGASGGSGGAAGTGTPAIATAGTNGATGIGRDLFGTFTSLGRNLISLRTGSTGFTNGVKNDIVGTNSPLSIGIAPLARNGGLTLTCAFNSPPVPAPGNLAYDAGDDTLATNLITDQRGFARLSGPHVDIGAYELQWPTSPLLAGSSVTNGMFSLTLTNGPGLAFLRVLRSSTLSTNWGSPVGTLSETAPGLYQWSNAVPMVQTQQFYQVRWP